MGRIDYIWIYDIHGVCMWALQWIEAGARLPSLLWDVRLGWDAMDCDVMRGKRMAEQKEMNATKSRACVCCFVYTNTMYTVGPCGRPDRHFICYP